MNAPSLGIKGKLVLLIVAALVVFTGTVTYALMGTRSIAKQIEKTNDLTMPFALKVGDVRSRTHAMMRFLWRSTLVDVKSEERKTSIAKLVDFREKLFTNIDELQQFKSISPDAKVLIEDAAALKKKIAPLLDIAVAHLEARSAADNQEIISGMGKELAPISTELTELGLKLADLADKYSQADADLSLAQSRNLQISMLLIAVGACVLFLAFGVIFANRVSTQLNNITKAVGNASLQVSSASEQLSNSSEQLSSSAQEQASALEQTSASLTEISTMSDANSTGAEQVDRSVKEVYQVSDETRKSMGELASAMKLILESNSRIEKLVKVIEEIGEKTEVIDEIVFKTQLLSFNASVEAERAGEHGRGFAVVAQEVGNLALVSGRAAQEISSIVKVSIKEAESVASENKVRVESGGILAQSTKDKMETVLTNLTGIINSIDKIVSACREQKQGINQISTSIQSLSQATQETAGTAEEAASASVELSGQGVSLLSLVSELRVIVSGAAEEAKKVGSSMSASSHGDQSVVVPMKSKSAKVRGFASAAPLKSTGTDGATMNGSSESGTAWEKL